MSIGHPLRGPRLLAYLLTFALGIVSVAVNAHAFVRSNDLKAEVRKAAGALITVHINTNDVLAAGTVVLVACAVAAVTTLLLSTLLLLPTIRLSRKLLSGPFLFLEALLLALETLWIFAAQIATTEIVAKHQAKLSARVGSTPVPQSIIQGQEKALGITPVYHKIGYLRTIAIVPWFAFLFALISTILTFMARSRARREARLERDGAAPVAMSEKEKPAATAA